MIGRCKSETSAAGTRWEGITRSAERSSRPTGKRGSKVPSVLGNRMMQVETDQHVAVARPVAPHRLITAIAELPGTRAVMPGSSVVWHPACALRVLLDS